MNKKNIFLFLTVSVIIIVIIYILNVLIKEQAGESLSGLITKDKVSGSIKDLPAKGSEPSLAQEEKQPIEQPVKEQIKEPIKEPDIPDGEPLLN